jgi:hypothetical protein
VSETLAAFSALCRNEQRAGREVETEIYVLGLRGAPS